ncbi:MAG: hypothetical protein OXT71_06010 [Acidobacteriota bacterium]|nr:hypothetical protein [Acidobacteriota bacterium]
MPHNTGERPLTKQAYKLRLEGLREAEGHIKANTLVRALGAPLGTAERATRLAATGRSVAKGRKPGWLKAAMNVTVTGLGAGSTTLDIQAPRLGDVRQEFGQRDFWLEQPEMGDTALDLGARAIREARRSDATGDHYDSSTLSEILKLGRAAEGAGEVRYELIPENGARRGFILETSECRGLRHRLDLIPASRAAVVSGRLDEIGHGQGRFGLLMGQGLTLPGRLRRSSLDVELLRPLWGKLATVQGLVHFKPNGQPRLIEAYRISARTDGDTIFETPPHGETSGQAALRRSPPVKAIAHVDPMVLWGVWPGDEPIEELLAQLD